MFPLQDYSRRGL